MFQNKEVPCGKIAKRDEKGHSPAQRADWKKHGRSGELKLIYTQVDLIRIQVHEPPHDWLVRRPLCLPLTSRSADEDEGRYRLEWTLDLSSRRLVTLRFSQINTNKREEESFNFLIIQVLILFERKMLFVEIYIKS